MFTVRPIEFHVLLALAKGPLHGYGLVQLVEAESDGRVKIMPGNLYTVLRRLETEGLVRKSKRRPAPGEDPRRRYFELTKSGQTVLAREAAHLKRLVARTRGLPLTPLLPLPKD